MLEWTDDLELFILKGYGNALNYRMGVPLLEDVVQSMEQAIKAKEGSINHIILLLQFLLFYSLVLCPFLKAHWLNLFLDGAGLRRLIE